MQKYLFSGIIIIALAGGVAWWKTARQSQPNPLDPFAQCLAQKGVTMYGADSCSHCQAEKGDY